MHLAEEYFDLKNNLFVSIPFNSQKLPSFIYLNSFSDNDKQITMIPNSIKNTNN